MEMFQTPWIVLSSYSHCKLVSINSNKPFPTFVIHILKHPIMSDNKNIQDGRDSSKVDGNSDYELDYVAQKLGVSREKVKEAIQAVGNSREKIEDFLKN